MRRIITAILLLCVLFGCNSNDPESRQWHAVLATKKAMLEQPAGSPGWHRARKRYADAVIAFVKRYPGHRRAERVLEELEIDFAHELVAAGRTAEAARYYRAVLARNGSNDAARKGLNEILDLTHVTAEELARIETGDSGEEVVSVLGAPPPEWKKTIRRGSVDVECWYYPWSQGGVCTICFRDGNVFAIDSPSGVHQGQR